MSALERGEGSLTTLLPAALDKVGPDERARLKAWCFEHCRHDVALRALLGQLLEKPLKARDRDIERLMLLGLFQLRHAKVAEHAAVDETVKLVRRLGKPWARGLVNAVLRRYLRERDALEAALDDGARLAMPPWFIERLERDWPEHWRTIAAAANAHPPMTLRVNRRHGDREHYRQRLAEIGITAREHDAARDALVLDTAVDVSELPGFDEGAASVQDAAAQLAVLMLEQAVPAGGRLVDVCAAPGGKTAHALESGHFSHVLALDNDPVRLRRVGETLARTGLADQAELAAVDAADTAAWWDGRPITALLLDAPCTASGVIRRHPDIKLLRRESDIAPLVATQRRLLDALWPLVADKGVLLYATCSVLRDENERQIQGFLERVEDAELDGGMRQVLPGEADMDGFFYAMLRKQAA
ncbi:MAG: 16S rRNA (cytosine(967)-C(5))-methyltransferase [Gammaproteobacteria bacterium]|nr:MAG: 16S rRNA (cytosine(967)-C(5))-methyltransferase [Gammaproteobacteria bacterium]PIE37049.1 MAG: 16S rRNA (cytosine(967)-C(5))-methyltransferase [Gammaproteobacteria bacterium]